MLFYVFNYFCRVVSNHSAKISRKKEKAEFIKTMEAQAKMLKVIIVVIFYKMNVIGNVM